MCELIEPFYPKPGNGRLPIGVERMLRIHFLQHWFNLSDPAVKEALYDSLTMRHFVGIDLGREPVPDETIVCRFGHLLDLGQRLFERCSGSWWPRDRRWAPARLSMPRSSMRRP
jgi:IS5 family transposase